MDKPLAVTEISEVLLSDLVPTVTRLKELIASLEEAVGDIRDTIAHIENERVSEREELTELQDAVKRMESYRQEQIELAIVEREIEVLTGRLAAAERRRSVLSL